MEIEEDLYNKYRDTPFRIENHQDIPQDDAKKRASKNLAAYNEFLDKIKKSLKDPNPKRVTDNISIRTSHDKLNQNNDRNYQIITNKTSYGTNIDTMNNSSNNDNTIILRQKQHRNNNDNNDKRNNVKFINNIYTKEIEYEISSLNENNPKNNVQNLEDKVMYTNNIFETPNNLSLFDNNNNNIYIKNDIRDNNPPDKLKEIDNQNRNINEDNGKNKPNFILTALNDNNKKSGKFSDDNNYNNNQRIKEINPKKSNNLDTLNQSLSYNPYLNDNNNNINNNINNNNFNNNNINYENDINKNNINLNEIPQEKKKRKFNFILTAIQNEKGKINHKGIEKLKNDLNAKEELIKYKSENNFGNNILPNNEGLIENHNIYGNQNNNNNNNYDNNKDKQCFYINAEPIEHNYKLRNYPDEENNLGTSSEIIELGDQNSEYTLQTGTNIDHLIKKKGKCSLYLIALLLGAAGLLFLLYKSRKLRKFFINLLKIIPGFFKGLFGMFGAEIEDFLEKYNDSYRLLGFIIMLICLWFILRLLFKYVAKLFKKIK